MRRAKRSAFGIILEGQIAAIRANTDRPLNRAIPNRERRLIPCHTTISAREQRGVALPIGRVGAQLLRLSSGGRECCWCRSSPFGELFDDRPGLTIVIGML